MATLTQHVRTILASLRGVIARVTGRQRARTGSPVLAEVDIGRAIALIQSLFADWQAGTLRPSPACEGTHHPEPTAQTPPRPGVARRAAARAATQLSAATRPNTSAPAPMAPMSAPARAIPRGALWA